MRSPLTIDIGPVLFAGRPITLDETVEVPPFASYTFPDGAHAELEIRRVDRGIDIDGTLQVNVRGECDRCLEEVTVPLVVPVEERFDPPGGTSDPFGENNVLSGSDLDVADLVRQLVTSALPQRFVCEPPCRGLSEEYHGEP